MFAWLWGRLPGPFAARVVLALSMLAAVLVLLFAVVFPAVEPFLPFDDVAVDQDHSTG